MFIIAGRIKMKIIKKPLWFYYLIFTPAIGFSLTVAITGFMFTVGSQNPLLNAGVGGLISSLLVSTEVVAKKDD